MAVSQSSVLATVSVRRGGRPAGHRSRVVVPETVFRTTGAAGQVGQGSAVRAASGPSAGTAATRVLGEQHLGTRPGALTGPRSSAASTSPRVSPAVRSSMRSSSSGVAGVPLLPAPQQRGGVRAERRPGVARAAAASSRSRAGVEGLVEGGDRGGGPVPEGDALRGQGEVVGGAVDEPDAEVLLQGGEGARDGGLGEAQAGGGAGDVALLGDGEEGRADAGARCSRRYAVQCSCLLGA